MQHPLPRLAGLVCAALLACDRPPAEPTPSTGAQALSAGTSPAPAPAPAPEAEAPAPAPPELAAPAPAPADPEPAAAGGLGKLSAEQRALLLAGGEDPLTETELHYVKSNEVRHDVWFEHVAGLGGAYVGVGSDQNYTVIAAAGSELAFLMDIDQSVVDLHRCYEALIEASPDPQTLHARWDAAHEAESAELVRAAHSDRPEAEQKRLVRLFKAARETVWIHLGHVIKRSREGRPTSWLSNPEMYAHIRGLYQADRVRMMAGNLTGESSLQSIGAAAKALGVPVRVVYFSNAEEYFDYTRQFASNIGALAGDERSVVLRTIYSKKWEHADQLWAYQVQPLTDFQARLGDRKNRSRNVMLRYAELDGTLDRATGVKGFSRIARPG